jgi:hypothetical protein
MYPGCASGISAIHCSRDEEVAGLAGDVFGLAAAVAERAGVAGVVQHVEHPVVGERPPHDFALALAGVDALREGQRALGELFDGRPRRAGALEDLEHERDRLADCGVGIEHDLARRVVDQADRQRGL